MVRSLVAVIASMVVMGVISIAAFGSLWFGLGADGLLQPESFKSNMLFAVAAAAITVIRGLFGGWMCAKIGRGTKPVMALAGIVLMLGLIMCYSTLQKPEPTGVRDPGMTIDQYFDNGREPTWLAIFNPIAGAATVLFGGMCIGAPRKPE